MQTYENHQEFVAIQTWFQQVNEKLKMGDDGVIT